jgi:hypothetical protein
MSSIIPITPTGTVASTAKIIKTLQGSGESFESSYDPVTDLVTITQSDGSKFIVGPVKNLGFAAQGQSFNASFTSLKGNVYKITAEQVT